MPVDFSVTNQLASPAIYASSFATRPAASFKGRLFVDTDNPSSGIYRDTGTAWIAIAGTSVGEIQNLNDVCVVGNSTTTLGIEIFGQSAFGEDLLSPFGQIQPFQQYALTIGKYSGNIQSLYVQCEALFNTTAKVNTSLTTPLLIGGDTTTSTLTYRTTNAAGITGARHIFQVGNNGATEAMTILNNGNIGVGTSSPENYLSTQLVVSAPLFGGITIVSTNATNTNYLCFARGTTTNLPYIGSISYNHNSDFMAFATVASEKMRIFSTGNIGINTTIDAGYKLDVNGTGRFSDTISIISNNSTTYSLNLLGRSHDNTTTLNFFSNNGATRYGFIYTEPTNMQFGVNGATRLTIASTGAATFSSSITLGNFTTVQKNALTAVAGMVVYDTTLNKLCVYTTAWETITSI